MARRNPAAPLHDVLDVEGFCKALLRKTGAHFTESDREEALGHLILCALEMSGVRHGRYAFTPGVDVPRGVYDPSKGIAFSTYLGRYLPGRLTDWYRKEKGDSRYRNRAELVPLDERATETAVDPYDYVEQIIEAASIADDLAALSARSRRILDEVVGPIARGESHDEAADRLGISRRKIARLLEEVRNELLGIALDLDLDDFPTTDEVIEALHALPLEPKGADMNDPVHGPGDDCDPED